MQARRPRYGWVLRLDPGEEIVETLATFAAREGVRAGLISGLGAVGETELGFFVPTTGEYTRRVFTGDHEIGTLTGNFSDLQGQPFPHCHIVLSGPDFVAHTGHLFRGRVSVTCEIHVVTDPEPQRRVRREGRGFSSLELGPDSGPE